VKPEATIFYDIDTQRDFLAVGGTLYAPIADEIRPRLAEITGLAREYSIRIVASIDRHRRGEPALRSGGGSIPDHCIDGTEGAKKIAETAPLRPLRLGHTELRPADIDEALAHDGEIIFDRRQFEALVDSPHAHAVLRLTLEPFSEIIMYGVYCSRCVERAVLALSGLGPKLMMVRDATFDVMGGRDSFDRLRSAGIELITLDELKSRLIIS
jgi:nicotinamidase-related amidase